MNELVGSGGAGHLVEEKIWIFQLEAVLAEASRKVSTAEWIVG